MAPPLANYYSTYTALAQPATFSPKPSGNFSCTAIIQPKQTPVCMSKQTPEGLILVVVSMDDFLVAARTIAPLNEFYKTLQYKYTTKDLGPPSNFLGWTNNRYSNGAIHIPQSQNVEEILLDNNLNEINRRSTPLPPKPEFDDHFKAPTLDSEAKSRFQSTVGNLRYLADSTRLNITYPTSGLATYIHSPTQKHLLLLTHLLRYLSGTHIHGILYYVASSEPLHTYTDTDLANSPERKSYSGAVHTALGASISWRSDKQRTVSLSTCEAEYIAASQALSQTIWLHRVLSATLPEHPTTPIPFSIDNFSAVKVANKTTPTKSHKHIDIRSHHLAHHHEQCLINIHHIPSINNPADLFTKSLPRQRLHHLQNEIRLYPLYSQTIPPSPHRVAPTGTVTEPQNHDTIQHSTSSSRNHSYTRVDPPIRST